MKIKRRLALGAVVAIASAALIGWIAVDGPGGRAALAVAITSFAAGLAAILIRANRATVRSIRRLELQSARQHKRASTWNYRLAKTVGVGMHPTISRSTETGGPSESVSRNSWIEAESLVASGIFDHELYVARTGGQWVTAEDAAAHFLRCAAPKGTMPTPLLSVDALPVSVRDALKRSEVTPLLNFLRSPEVTNAPLSPLFDASQAPEALRSASLHRGGVLGAWVASAHSDTPLPVPRNSVVRGATLASVREPLIAHAVDVRAAAAGEPERDSREWDAEAEFAWISTLLEQAPGALPTVTVVMPVRNRVGLVPSAIASVQAQTVDGWQLIVVDDGSTDGTRELIEDIAAHDSRIEVMDSGGAGVSASRNLGLTAATGEYIAFLDSDNAWVPHFLELMLRGMRRDGYLAAYSAAALHQDDGSVVYRALRAGVEQLRLRNHIDLNVLVVHRSITDDGARFDETLRRWVDHDFALKTAKRFVPVLLPFVGCHYTHSAHATDRITVRESEHWQWVALERYWVDWAAASPTVPGRLSVVVPTYNDFAMTAAAVKSVLQDAAAFGIDVEVQIVDNGSKGDVGQRLLSDIAASPAVHYLRLPRNLNFAIACNVGIVRASGEHVLLLNNDTVVRRGALAKMLSRLVPGVLGVQPLLVYADETIQTAGTVFVTANSMPTHFLVGHPKEDALELGEVAFDAATAAALLMRTADLRALRGFDAIFVNGMEDVDLCLRGRKMLGGRFAIAPEAVVTHFESKTPGRGANIDENRRIFLDRWRGQLPNPQVEIFAQAGFKIAHVGTDGREVPGPRPLIVREPADQRVRWGIHIAAIPGALGDDWGDAHYAESLRGALADLGQRAVVHRHGAHTTAAAGMDDVALVIRGLDRVRPMPGKRNLLWVISHPDKVSIEEIREFDLVFAASESWAARMSQASGRPVEPLLQATDASRFHDGVQPTRTDAAALFVGKAFPGRDRQIVRDALEAGVSLAVYGPGWEGQLPAGVLRGNYVENESLASYYRGARRVLADHWLGMAAEGFVQNRLFDAVASGARVVCDVVPGAADLFHGAVRSYSTAEELSHLCSPESDSQFPDNAQMAVIAKRVRETHSFHARARRLIEAAQEFACVTPGAEGLCGDQAGPAAKQGAVQVETVGTGAVNHGCTSVPDAAASEKQAR